MKLKAEKKQFKIIVEMEYGNIANGEKELKDTMEAMGYEVKTVKYISQDRTSLQNKALHVYFKLLATALADAGYSVKDIITVDIPWSPVMVKEILWRRTQKKVLGIHSTTRLKRKDLDEIYRIVDKTISEETGGNISIPFPSKELLEQKSLDELRL